MSKSQQRKFPNDWSLQLGLTINEVKCLQAYKHSAWPKNNVEWVFFAWHKKGTKRMYVSVLAGVFEKGDNRYWFMSRPIFYSVSIQIPRHCRRIKTETWLRPFMSNLMKMSIKKTLLRMQQFHYNFHSNCSSLVSFSPHLICSCFGKHLKRRSGAYD